MLNREAWNILSEDEKLSLNIQHGHSKSSWQAGEIMNKSHYKYLEIKYRAEQFLKLFTTHLNMFGTLVPEEVTGEPEIIEYFKLAITQRLKVSQITEILDKKYGYSGKKTRSKELIEQMKKWEDSENAYNVNFYNLIKEFDRWNNFRILPIEIREPSAFKRRNSKEHKKNIRVASSIPPISVPLIRKLYGHKRADKNPAQFLPLITSDNTAHILGIRSSDKTLEELNQVPLYVFKTKEQAKAYNELLKGYLSLGRKGCRDGLEFWPKYRDLIKLAVNYDPIQKIIPSRKYLTLAIQKLAYI